MNAVAALQRASLIARMDRVVSALLRAKSDDALADGAAFLRDVLEAAHRLPDDIDEERTREDVARQACAFLFVYEATAGTELSAPDYWRRVWSHVRALADGLAIAPEDRDEALTFFRRLRSEAIGESLS